MVSRPKRRCVTQAEEQRARIFAGAPDAAATDDDRAKWTGWSDLESEPAIFNSILAKWGVKGVRTCEVTCMDAETLRDLPQPIYGIIFLYRYSEVEPEREDGDEDDANGEDALQEGRPWFAMQNMHNMCGSLALLNMVMNIDGLELGGLLARLKADTACTSPADRGEAVADFAALRRIHNSWAKKVDMLNQDLKLQQDFTKARGRRGGGSKRKRKDEEADEMAYHFVAYMPVDGQVWKLDGLEEGPERLEQRGRGEGDWLDQVSDVLSQRMAEFIGNDISFNVLAMTRDPVFIAREQLARNITSLRAITTRLQELQHTHRPAEAMVNGELAVLNGESKAALGRDKVCNGSEGDEVTPDDDKGTLLLSLAEDIDISEDVLSKYDTLKEPSTCTAANNDPEYLASQRTQLAAKQGHLREAYRETKAIQHAEACRADAREREYGPLVARWVKCLAHVDDPDTGKSMLETLISKV